MTFAAIAGVTRVFARGIEAAADWGSLKSAENYVGHARTQNFASPGGAVVDKARKYRLPAMLRLNEWGLSGDWTVTKEAAALNQPKFTLAIFISSWVPRHRERP